MALCHLGHVDWADSTAELKETPGLTPFGRDVVKACQDWGILVDLSHASDQTCWHTLEVATKPIMATHTKCRALTHSARDLSDELIRAIADTGGVVAFWPPPPRPQKSAAHTASSATGARWRTTPTRSNWPRPSSPTPRPGAPSSTWRASITRSTSPASITWVCRRTSRMCRSGASSPRR